MPRTRPRPGPLVAAVAGLAVLAALTGCANTRFADDGGGGGTTVALSVSTLNNPFFVALRDGAQEAAKKNDVELVVTDAQNDAAKQQNDIQSFVTRDVDAILVNPVDSAAVVPAVKAANEADIPVVALDRGSEGGSVATTIASDNVTGGRMAAEFLAEQVGSGEVLSLEGIPGTDVARDRGDGFTQGMADASGVEVVASQPADFDRAEGLNVTENLLQSHPSVSGIFAQNDEMALGALKALGSRAGKVTVVGFDGTPEALAAVADGRMAGTVAQQPDLIGSRGVAQALAAVDGKSLPATQEIPVRLVTPGNVDRFGG